MWRKGTVLLLLTSFVFALPGCATLFNSGSANVPMSSDPTGAEVIVDGNRRGTTPVTLELDNNSKHTVVFQKEGYKDVTCELGTSVGAGWVVLDVLGGLAPIIIDAATGKWKSLNTKNCNVTMREADGS